MPRTFSLARLLLAITAIALLCGLAVNYPVATSVAAFFVPGIATWLVIMQHSNHPLEITVVSLIGVVIVPVICAPPTVFLFWCVFPDTSQNAAAIVVLIATSVGVAVGTLLFGGGLLIYELRQRQRQNL